jgi:hypothetical protein
VALSFFVGVPQAEVAALTLVPEYEQSCQNV